MTNQSMNKSELINRVNNGIIVPIEGLKEALEDNLRMQRENPRKQIESVIVPSIDDADYEACARLMASAVPTEFTSFGFYYGTQTPVVPDSLDEKPHLIYYFDLPRNDNQIKRVLKWEGGKWLTRHDYEYKSYKDTYDRTTLYVDFGEDAESAALWWAWLIQECYHVPTMPYTYDISVRGDKGKLMKKSVKDVHGFDWRIVPFAIKYVACDLWKLVARRK